MAVKLILVTGEGHRFFVRDLSEDFHTQHGFVSKVQLAKAKPGTVVKSNKGVEFSVLGPSFTDIYSKIKRAPQIIPRKDVGSIIAETGLGRTSVVVDAGAGSGALALFLANIVKRIYTYEIREDFAKVVLENIELFGFKNIVVKHKDVYQGIDEKNVDLVTLDLPEPWKAVIPAAKALKVGGFLVSYSPTIPQVSDFVQEVGKSGNLMVVRTLEIIEREWEFRDRVVRPLTQQIGHSGFLTFVRKVKQ